MKNEEKFICAPMIIRVEARVAGRIALSAPIPLRSQSNQDFRVEGESRQ